MPKSTRAQRLRETVPSWYSGTLHLAILHVMGFWGVAWCISLLDQASLWEWMLVPVFFVFANWFEWWIHKGPLHEPTRGLYFAYQGHTLTHHVVYTEDSMDMEGPRELLFVLFPPWLLPVLLVINTPLVLALAYFGSANLAFLFYASAIAYHLVYEWFHLLHHLPAAWPISQRPTVRWLRRHHARHHNLRLMNKGNFNVSFPLWDLLLGTMLPNRERP